MGQRFDLESWIMSRPPLTRAAKRWAGATIDRPAILAATLWARQQRVVRTALIEPVPCDIALYAIGQPESPECTHLGGAAWMPVGTDWPHDSEGDPTAFLGQVYFGDSLDSLDQDLPGIALQVYSKFNEEGWIEIWDEEDISLVWLTARQLRRGSWQHRPAGGAACAPVACHLFRTEDFRHIDSTTPATEDMCDPLRRLSGTKIGGLPVWIQSDDEDHPKDSRFVCSIGSMYHMPKGTRDVFVNEPDYDTTTLHQLGGAPCWGDMGIINVMRRKSGEFYAVYECC